MINTVPMIFHIDTVNVNIDVSFLGLSFAGTFTLANLLRKRVSPILMPRSFASWLRLRFISYQCAS